ncbi:MAG: RNA pyrophosphohydrolase [Rhodospirillales bacterium]
MKSHDLPYRSCVGAMLFNADGLVFVGRRAGVPAQDSAWQMPQGGIDPGEGAREAIRRECREEIGTDNFEILAESADWHVYDLPDDLIGKTWGGRYRGQKQKWFALRFTGADRDVDLRASKHVEFSAWKWVGIDDLPNLIIPFKRKVYQGVIEEFRPWAEILSRRC